MTHTQKSIAYFVTGTDTEIGKTLVSSALVYQCVQHGQKTGAMKPVASGADWNDGQWCNADVQALRAQMNVAIPLSHMNPYLMREATAPHIAAHKEGKKIDLAHIQTCLAEIRSMAERVIVEGVGGFMVPLHDDVTAADLAKQLGLPVILVVGIRLGCINHALLTAQAIEAKGLMLAGWVANHVSDDMLYAQENVATLQRLLRAPLLGEVPYLEDPTAQAASAFIDMTRLL